MATKKMVRLQERMGEFTKEAKGKQAAGQGEGVDVKLFATRIPKEYVKAIKVYVAQNEITIKEFVHEAIREAMEKRGIL